MHCVNQCKIVCNQHVCAGGENDKQAVCAECNSVHGGTMPGPKVLKGCVPSERHGRLKSIVHCVDHCEMVCNQHACAGGEDDIKQYVQEGNCTEAQCQKTKDS